MTASINSIKNFATLNTPIEPYRLPLEKRLEGDPEQTIQNHYASACEQFHSGVWSSEVGTWQIKYTEEEYCEILEGCSKITDLDGNSLTVAKGDRFVIPKGFEGTWEVIGHCKKIYVIYEQK